MPRTAEIIPIEQIRVFTDRNGGTTNTWLPSTGNDEEYKNTFTLEGEDLYPQTGESISKNSKGEINALTVFGSGKSKNGKTFPQNSGIELKSNLDRYHLALYCLKALEVISADPANAPAKDQITGFADALNVLNYSEDDTLFINSIAYFIEQQQIGKAKGLTADEVRNYIGNIAKNPKNIGNDIQKLLNFASNDVQFRKSVAGVLDRITYDSVVKNTLFYLLKKEGLLNTLNIPNSAFSWTEKAQKLNIGEFDYYIDPTGGPYSRAFPVVCVMTKDASGKKDSDILDKANEFISSKFLRNITSKQLVTQILDKKGKPVAEEKIFIERPNSTSGDSFYCFVYDFTKIIVLDPDVKQDFTLDIIKICLSFLTTKTKSFESVNSFVEYYLGISKYLKGQYNESLEKEDFIIKLKKKHSEECAYIFDKNASDYKAKFEQSFKAELKQVLESLDNVYTFVIETFNKETRGENRNFQFKGYRNDIERPITLHFDNFYNLLAVSSYNSVSVPKELKEYPSDSPFDLKQYEFVYDYGDTVVQFFDPTKPPLPTIPENAFNLDYIFIDRYSTYHDVVFVTDVFLKQSYEILEPKKDALIYDNDKNAKEDKVLKADSIKLIELLKERTGVNKNLTRSDIIYFSSNNYYLKKEIIKVLRIKDFNLFSFQGVKEDKIKFQTINHLLFAINEQLEQRSLGIDDFQEIIYYPVLNKITPTPPPPGKKKEETKKTPDPKKDKDFLINNIISSELACYEDISNSFEKAKNAETEEDKLYFVFQTISNIALPILLTMAASLIAEKLANLVKEKGDLSQEQLDCIQQDRDNIKKNILGYADLFSNLNSPEQLFGYLTQGYLEIPTIPPIPYFITFDVEKELKRRITKFIIDLFLEYLGKLLGISLQSLKDMCNSDSYLTSFLNSALPNVDKSGAKKDFATPSGLPGSASPTIFIPQIIVNINTLILQSNIQTPDVVYQLFREKYLVSYENTKISNFFAYLSNSIDAGQMASLLKGTSALETRLTLVSYIKNYQDKDFYTLISDSAGVANLFDFLSLYIDYQLCYGIISDSVNNFTGNICEDVDSKYGESALEFGETAIEDEINDLTKTLDQICSSKNQPSIDLLLGGPLLITKGVKRSLGIAIEQNTNSINQHSELILSQIEENQELEDPFKNLAGSQTFNPSDIYHPKSLTEIYISGGAEIFSSIISQYYDTSDQNLFINGLRFTQYINKIVYDGYQNYKQVFSAGFVTEQDKIAFFKQVYQSGPKNAKFKKAFNQKLDSGGNAALKTEITTINGYVRKLQQLNTSKIKIEIN